MKKFLLGLILLICFPLAASSFNPLVVCGGQTVASGGYDCADDDMTGELLQERFECGSTDGNEEQTWTSDNTPDFDYTGTILQGTESLQMDTSDRTRASFTGTGEVWAAIIYRPTANATTSRPILSLWDSGNNGLASAHHRSGTPGSLAIYSGGTLDITDVSLTLDTTIYIKLWYKKGTGANSEAKIYTSADGSSWTEKDAISGENETGDAAKVVLGEDAAGGAAAIFDDIRVDDADIDYQIINYIQCFIIPDYIMGF